MNFQLCFTGLFFDNQQVEFYSDKESNEQGFWLDDENKCERFTNDGYYFVTEMKIKNGKVFTACDLE